MKTEDSELIYIKPDPDVDNTRNIQGSNLIDDFDSSQNVKIENIGAIDSLSSKAGDGCQLNSEDVTVKMENVPRKVGHEEVYRKYNHELQKVESDINIKEEVVEVKHDYFIYTSDDLKVTSISYDANNKESESQRFLCNYCEFRTKHKANLIRHFKLKHDENNEFCDNKTKPKSRSRQYFSGKDEWYHCEVCDFRTKRKSDLIRHFIAKHDKEAVKTNEILKEHFTAELDQFKWYHCQVCDYKTKRKDALKRHFATKHDSKVTWYHCKVCDHRSKRKDLLKQHFTANHDTEAKWYQCQVCDYKTKRQDNFRQHFTTRHDKKIERFQCQVCDFRTKYKYYLKIHFREQHDEKVEWYQCQVCDFRTKYKSYMKKHLVRKHRKEAEKHSTLSHDEESKCYQHQPSESKIKFKEEKDDGKYPEDITVDMLHHETDIKSDPNDTS